VNRPVIGHPAADVTTPEALVVEQGRNVVPLSHWISDAALVAKNSGRRLQLLTPPYSRITFPLEVLIRECRAGRWVLRSTTDSGFVDGLTGQQMFWDGAKFAPITRGGGEPATGSASPSGVGSVELTIETLHSASEALQLGASTVAAVIALTGAEPTGWGTAEPVSQPWSARELTDFCRARAPQSTCLVIVGGQPTCVVGVLTVTVVTTGVLEELRLTGPPSVAVNQGTMERLADQVAATARTMLVAVNLGRADTTRSAGPTAPALPYGVLLGHQVVGRNGLDHAGGTPLARGARLVGAENRKGYWCRLDGDPEGPFSALTDVLVHFGLTTERPANPPTPLDRIDN
jgi:hypothetical protein